MNRRMKEDVFMACMLVRRITCSVCGAQAESDVHPPMDAAAELFELGWTAEVPVGTPATATCPDCGIL